MKLSRTLLALALLGAAGMAHAAGNCTISLKGDDAMKFDLREATVSASCATLTVELAHTGKMPVAAMGHNVVISTTAGGGAGARQQAGAGQGRERHERFGLEHRALLTYPADPNARVTAEFRTEPRPTAAVRGLLPRALGWRLIEERDIHL